MRRFQIAVGRMSAREHETENGGILRVPVLSSVRLRRLCAVLCGATALLAAGSPADAQERDRNPAQIQLTRAELQALYEQYQANSTSPAYSEALRAQARREAERIRLRLEEGDFQIGDQVALTVEGEQPLTGNFLVQEGPALVLPTVGTVSLKGVLRSELEGRLREELARYIRDPVVQARSSIRIIITGAVGKAGYYVVPTDLVASEIFAVAGGPAGTARLDQVRVERRDQVIWSGDALQQAIIEGRTLDQLGFRAGDEIVVPEARPGGAFQTIQPLVYGLGSVVALIGFLVQVF